MEFQDWDGSDLTGKYVVSIKIDGVRAIQRRGVIKSRKGNPLYNIPKFKGEHAEIYTGNFDQTLSIVRTAKMSQRQIRQDEIYTLYPKLDKRLEMDIVQDPTKEQITAYFQEALSKNYEGLVLRPLEKGKKWIKVKKSYTVDAKITGLYPGKAGKTLGKLGGFITDMGRVGTGISMKQREEYNTTDLIGTYIEVEYMEITKNGKWRSPRFIRLRPDK